MKTKEDLIKKILFDFKNDIDSISLTYAKLKKLFLNTCDVCLGDSSKYSATCGSKECVSEIKSRNSRKLKEQGIIKPMKTI